MATKPRRMNVEKTKAGMQIVAPWAAGVMDTVSRTGRLKPGQEDVSRGPLFTQEEAEREKDAAARQKPIDED